MKNLKFKMSVLALVLGMGSAFATIKHQDADRKWSKDLSTGAYSEITGETQGVDYLCTEGADVCTATYPQDVDPNHNPDNVQPISVETGVFN